MITIILTVCLILLAFAFAFELKTNKDRVNNFKASLNNELLKVTCPDNLTKEEIHTQKVLLKLEKELNKLGV